jgi:heme-degrading monooxygenase HmoA
VDGIDGRTAANGKRQGERVVHTIVWEFRVKPGAIEEFENHYGPSGTWVAFFRKGDGYRETRLLRDDADPTRYLTIDMWDDVTAYRAFRETYSAEYAALDAVCEALTTEERLIGQFGVAVAQT